MLGMDSRPQRESVNVATGKPFSIDWPLPLSSGHGQSPQDDAPPARAQMARDPDPYLGHVEVADEQSAIEKASKEFRVPENLRNRIAVQRDERRSE